VLKKLLLAFAGLVVVAVVFGTWLFSLAGSEADRRDLEHTRPEDLSYISQRAPQTRGRILAVVTSTDALGESGERTGYELTELARAYYVFAANGFEVDVASPRGGEPPAVVDDDLGAFDYAFLNDTEAQAKVAASLPVSQVDADAYDAIYFVGGKGAMFDFPNNGAIQTIVREAFESGKVLGAVCHGSAAFVNATLSNGRSLLADRSVSGFTNEEELLLIPDAREIFPFLLQDALSARGATFSSGPLYLEHVSQDGNVVTGQNPWSVWAMAERMVRQLGYTPVPREVTPEETSVAVLLAYEMEGYANARARLESELAAGAGAIDRSLIAVHSMVAARQGRIGKAVDLIRLLRSMKDRAG
jgi:putative intracellular protease/amidase